ncbi:VCBS repeat-containing protein [Marinilongibacter aquaticus]|uniref:VCBS repeat-containing protein n=1 Tax=Marinilongibacter aquaticus TaxID=2975157 RepID=UPI0021BD9C52|nr:VCBS repeat-containing protein [Marinilongibacter aquaticus]UBM59025.1 VCBS repeat-containing protein [Marinilongibacter aquaticus]
MFQKKVIKWIFISALIFVYACKPSVKQFEKVSSEDSGLTFVNKITSTPQLNAFTSTNFYNGGGVALADFNNDGLEDVFFTSNMERSKLFLAQDQKLHFKDFTAESGLKTTGWCNGVATVDINQDGLLDIYISKGIVPNEGYNNRNQLFVNKGIENGVPVFEEEAEKYGLAFAGYTTQTVFLDYDKDGDLDAFLLNTYPVGSNLNGIRPKMDNGQSPSTNKLFRNEGEVADGQYFFVDVSEEAGIVHEGLGLGVAVSDFNMDGWPDIYCSNDFQSDDNFYLNNGDGTFRYLHKEVLAHTSKYGMGVDVADLNNDSFPEIFQLDMLPEDNYRQKMMISGSDFEKKLLSTSPAFNYLPQYSRNTLQLNQSMSSKPQFSEVGLWAGVAKTDWSWAPLLADFDNNGHKDMYITNGYRRNVTDLDFIKFNRSMSSFGSAQSRNEQMMQKLDQVPEIKLSNYAFRNSGEFPFEKVSENWGLDEPSYSNGAAYADLDLDGDLDLVVNNIDQEAFLYENKNANGFYLNVKLKGQVPNLQAIGAKVAVFRNGQGQFLENYPVRAYLSVVSENLHFGFSTAGNVDSLIVTWPDDGTQKLTDVPLGQNLVIEKGSSSAKKSAFVNEGLFSLSEEVPIRFTHSGNTQQDFSISPTLLEMRNKLGGKMCLADLNRDGLEDVLIGKLQHGQSELHLFYQREAGEFEEKVLVLSATADIQFLEAADLTADGFPEVVLGFGENASYALSKPQILRNNRGEFSGEFVELPAAISCVSGVLHDFDQDGDVDMLLGGDWPIRFSLQARTLFFLENTGSAAVFLFTERSDEMLAELNLSGTVHAMDLFKDGKLALAGQGQAPTILEFNSGKFVKRGEMPKLKGKYYSLKLADFDLDGDEDILVGNGGTNRLFQASADQPIRIYRGDFNKDNYEDWLCTYWQGNKVFPVQDLGTMEKIFPALRQSYGRYSDYAKASFDEVFGDIVANNSFKQEIETMYSYILKNDGPAGFQPVALPYTIDMGPVMDFFVDDFNADGFPDFAISGNYFANDSNLGPMDANGIQLFLGDGQCGFKALVPCESGLFSNQEGRSLNGLNVGGRPYLLQSNYNGNLVFWQR